jgi:tRNA-Thr(GGU) m(6)t(6)A37 methyltransferase TsaA
MERSDPRPGEQRLDVDPAGLPGDARLVFIGRVRTTWTDGQPAPKNPARARESGTGAVIEIDPPYRSGLAGLAAYSHVIVLVWLDRARRDLITLSPRHVTAPTGVFALRSPIRPNPIGLSVARIVEADATAGIVRVDALEFFDGTPVIDLKPYRPGIDAVPDAVVP